MNLRYKIAIIIFIILSTIGGIRDCKRAWGEEIDDHLAIKAIVGEASNQGYKGMLYLAIGIRNRGHLRGVYGVNAKHNDSEPQWVWDLARRAWAESEYNRFHIADHWENIEAFGKPDCFRDMVVVCKYKNHTFFKEIK